VLCCVRGVACWVGSWWEIIGGEKWAEGTGNTTDMGWSHDPVRCVHCRLDPAVPSQYRFRILLQGDWQNACHVDRLKGLL
jgi:hypothetical protein